MYTSPPLYVRTQDELDTALTRLAPSPFVAIDTEFLREKTYFPKFCLLQIADDNFCALIDVLELPTLRPLLDFLDDRARVKVLHAAHQDLEVLALANGALHGVMLKPIAGPFFDSQVAAAFLDMPANIGYADLVQRRLHHTLNKGQARTDWSQRPLSEEQLVYAAADVIYLVELYHDLKAALLRNERLSWLEEEASALEDPSLYGTNPSDAWERLRGLEQMSPEPRAAAKLLAQWREQRAIAKDLPRSWILADDVLRLLAERLPSSIEELGKIPGISKGTLDRRGAELLALFEQAKLKSVDERPADDFRPTPAQQKLVRSMMDYVRKESSRLKISPELLATRRAMESLVFSGKIGAFGSGWRFQSYGERLILLANQERQRIGQIEKGLAPEGV